MMLDEETKARQRAVRATLNQESGVDYMCSECLSRAYTEDDETFEHCRAMRHSIMKMYTKANDRRPDGEDGKRSYQDMVLSIMAGGKYVTLTKTHEIMSYQNGVYRYNAEERISQRCRMIEPKYTKHDISEVVAIIQDKTGYRDISEFDADENIINVSNGLVNIQTGELLEHDPNYLSRVQLDVTYDPHAIPSRFLRFIGTAHADPQNVYRIFEMMGACLIRDNRWLTKAWMHLGQGSNGKSRLFDILGAVLGEKTMTSHSIHDIEKNRFALASLDGKLANICGDIEENELTKTGNLKKVIAGDVMPAEKKFLQDYNFRPFCKLIFSANGLPQTPDESDGFARRFEIIEWNRQFWGKDRDYTVFTIYQDPVELSGVFNIMVRHAQMLLRTRHLKFESSVAEMKAQWKERSSSVERFSNDECVKDPEYEIETGRLYSEYVIFCKNNKLSVLDTKKFKKDIERLGIQHKISRRNGESMRLYSGITLRRDLREKDQEIL